MNEMTAEAVTTTASPAGAPAGRKLSTSMRFGLLGASRAAERIIRAAQQVPSVRITALASRSDERAARLLESLPDADQLIYDDLLTSKHVDAVYISLPNAFHFEWAMRAIRAGKHVLVAKPMLLDPWQVEQIEDAAEEHGVAAMEAMWWRYHAQTGFLRDLIASDDLGTLRQVTGSCGYLNPDPTDIRWDKRLGGGAVADLFCYHADLMTHVLRIRPEDIVRVESFARCRNAVPASVHAAITTRAGTTLDFTTSIERDYENRTAILGTKGACDVPDPRVFPELGGSEVLMTGKERRRTFARENAYANMLSAFVEGARGRRELMVPLDDTRANLRITAMVEKACRIEMADRTALLPKLNSQAARMLRRLIGTSSS